MSTGNADEYWLGFDLGGTKMHAAIYDRKLSAIDHKRKKTRGFEGAKSGVERMVSIVEKLLEDAKITASQLSGIGVGCPGPLDLEKGVICESPNLGWKNVPLKSILEEKFGCPAVLLNDVDAGVFGEYTCGEIEPDRTVLGVFPGTGIGAGLVYHGEIFRGRKTSCLELGHFPVVPNGALCGCGRRGCLETVASRLSMSAEVAKAAYRGQAPHVLRLAGTDLSNIRSGTLAEAIRDGDKSVEQILRQGARYLGVVIAGAVNMLAPDHIILGGGLVEALPKLFLDEVEGALKDHVMPSYEGTWSLKTAKLGDDAGSVGAAAWIKYLQTQKNAKGSS